MTDAAMSAGPAFAPGTSDAEIEAAAARAAAHRRHMVLFWRWFILAMLLGGWELASRFQWIDPFFYSAPSSIGARLWEWIVEGTSIGSLWYQLWVTMEEAAIGFVAGAVTGVVVGIALGRDRFLADIFSIYIKVFNAIPRVVLAPIFVMILGLGLASKVALAFIMVFFVVFANAFQGVREADRSMIANAQILGASPWNVTRSVTIPAAMSWIFASLHVSFGLAIVGAIVGEFVGSRYGIGQLISIARGSYDPAGMFAAIVIIMIVALVAEQLMTMVEHRLAKWRPAPLQETN